MTKDKHSSVIRELSANINRLDALGFDSGYAAGYENGVKYAREQIASEIEKRAMRVPVGEFVNGMRDAVVIARGESD